MREKSLDFLGFHNYTVTDDGRVFSLNYHRSGKKKEMKPNKDKKGYNRIELFIEGKCKSFFVHRLVALAFLPNHDNLPLINHKDENPLNNKIDNLEWCDYSYNNTYGTRLERVSKTQLNRKDQSKPVKQFTKDGVFIKEYPSIKEAERQNGLCKSNIIKVCKGEKFSCGGYIWRYSKVS